MGKGIFRVAQGPIPNGKHHYFFQIYTYISLLENPEQQL